MALLSETISESKGFQPVSERKRCVGAIRAMIQLAQGHIMGALPQVRVDRCAHGLTDETGIRMLEIRHRG